MVIDAASAARRLLDFSFSYSAGSSIWAHKESYNTWKTYLDFSPVTHLKVIVQIYFEPQCDHTNILRQFLSKWRWYLSLSTRVI